MPNYARIERKIWNSRTFLALDEDSQKLWLYILTCPHGNILGMFILKPGYVLEDLNWSQQRFTKAFSKVLEIPLANGQYGLVKYDEENKLILIKNFLEHNPLTNPNQVKSAISKILELPDSQLFQDLIDILEVFSKGLHKDLTQALRKRLGKHSATVTVTDTVTDTDIKRLLPCPHEDIIDLWNNEMISEGISAVKVWGKNRREHLNTRWKEKEERRELKWWLKLFTYIKRKQDDGTYVNKFLMGAIEPSPGRKRFLVTLPWLVSSEEHIAKVQEGFYER